MLTHQRLFSGDARNYIFSNCCYRGFKALGYRLNPGLCGRFLGLVLGFVFYAIAFSGSVLPPEFWQTVGETLRTQLQENIKYFVSSILPQ